jgi:hypothetical protein
MIEPLLNKYEKWFRQNINLKIYKVELCKVLFKMIVIIVITQMKILGKIIYKNKILIHPNLRK